MRNRVAQKRDVELRRIWNVLVLTVINTMTKWVLTSFRLFCFDASYLPATSFPSSSCLLLTPHLWAKPHFGQGCLLTPSTKTLVMKQRFTGTFKPASFSTSLSLLFIASIVFSTITGEIYTCCATAWQFKTYAYWLVFDNIRSQFFMMFEYIPNMIKGLTHSFLGCKAKLTLSYGS